MTDWRALIALALGLIGLGFTILNVTVQNDNLSLQQRIAERQQVLAQAASLRTFNDNFIKALANLSAQSDDENLRQLLADYGVTFTVNEPPAAEQPDE